MGGDISVQSKQGEGTTFSVGNFAPGDDTGEKKEEGNDFADLHMCWLWMMTKTRVNTSLISRWSECKPDAKAGPVRRQNRLKRHSMEKTHLTFA